MLGVREVGLGRIAFEEGPYAVRTLESEEEHLAAHRLRHAVFADRLQWVPASPDGLEMDAYDEFAVSLGLFSEGDRLVGVTRLLPAEGPLMLEEEFSAFLPPGYTVRKASDTIEITRLAVDPTVSDRGLSSRMMLALFKGVYQWCLRSHVRYCYMEVEQRFLRVLRVIGFPCEAIGPPVALPPAYALSLAALLDWDRFRSESAISRPAFLEWISTTRSGTVIVEGAALEPPRAGRGPWGEVAGVGSRRGSEVLVGA